MTVYFIVFVLFVAMVLGIPFYLWNWGPAGPAKRGRRRRIMIYALITGVIESSLIWMISSPIWYEQSERTWFYRISYNVGLLFFPLGYGLIVTGFLGLFTGIIFMFFFITVIGETISRLRRKREKHE